MEQKVNARRVKQLIWLIFLGYILWWFYINGILQPEDHASIHNKLFTNTYGVMALLGGIVGIVASRKWGGRKSLVGKALLFFSIGLLFQVFGQATYSFYYYVLEHEAPYPSLADVGYFGSVLIYIYASWQLAKAAGVKMALKRRSKKVLAVILPLLLLVTSYLFFLQDYVFDFSTPQSTLTVLLDFGYPLGQAIYIAIALVTYLLSQKLLGGIMRNKILLILFALLIQFAADFSYLYAAQRGTFYAAGTNDLMYFLAYTIMAIALNSFRSELTKPIKSHTGDEKDG